MQEDLFVLNTREDAGLLVIRRGDIGRSLRNTRTWYAEGDDKPPDGGSDDKDNSDNKDGDDKDDRNDESDVSGLSEEQLRAELKSVRREAARRRVKIRDLEAKEQERLEAASQAEQEQLEKKEEYKTLYENSRKELEQERNARKQAETASLRARIGSKLGVPAGLVDRLRGETEEEITADAEAVLAEIPKNQDGDGKKREKQTSRVAPGGQGTLPRTGKEFIESQKEKNIFGG